MARHHRALQGQIAVKLRTGELLELDPRRTVTVEFRPQEDGTLVVDGVEYGVEYGACR